jgi:hypothetical protein
LATSRVYVSTYHISRSALPGNLAGLAKTLKDLGIGAVDLCSPIGYPEFAPLADGKQTKQISTRKRRLRRLRRVLMPRRAAAACRPPPAKAASTG